MKNRKRKKHIIILFILVLGLSVGFALLQTNLTINGSSKIKGSSWDIHFENLNVTESSVELSDGDVAASIQTSTTDISYTITLNKPGDFYEFTVDAVNAGSIDGMVESVTSKLNDNPITTLPAYLDYSVSYNDGIAILPNQYLKAGKSETYKVRIEFKKDILSSDLPTSTQTLALDFGVSYIQADNSAINVCIPNSFETDDWSTVVCAAKRGLFDSYNVRDTRTIELESFGNHILRIANTSTPEECLMEGFSQTACGVVLEFADIISTHVMNSTLTNEGGWPASEMRAYINNDIYNSLPLNIKNTIIDTRVVSGHGSIEGESNFSSIDKLYLLSIREVYEGYNTYDSAYNNSKQLDYYKELNVTSSSFSGASKPYENSNHSMWLRTAVSSSNTNFGFISSTGFEGGYLSTKIDGVSPAFRIA